MNPTGPKGRRTFHVLFRCVASGSSLLRSVVDRARRHEEPVHPGQARRVSGPGLGFQYVVRHEVAVERQAVDQSVIHGETADRVQGNRELVLTGGGRSGKLPLVEYVPNYEVNQ